MTRFSVSRLVAFVVIGTMVVGFGPPVTAAEYPVKGRSITVIVPWAAGGNADTFTRVLQPALEKAVGTRIEVVNVPGAGAQVGWTQFSRAKPDGYTIAHMSQPNVATIIHDPRRQAVFTSKSFEIVSVLVQDPGAIAVKADGPYKTLKDLVEAARANPGKIKVSCGALMGDTHFTGLTFQKATGTKLAIANFDGGVAPAITAMIGGHADASSVPVPSLAATVKAGHVRVLGVLKSEPSKFLPDVPTVESQGYKGGVFGSYSGIAVPAGTPREIITALATALKKAMEDPEIVKKMNDVWQETYVLGPEESAKVWERVEGEAKVLLAEVQR
jgi:tripartite-type tricarboxylate transporter receptor subunit TctC